MRNKEAEGHLVQSPVEGKELGLSEELKEGQCGWSQVRRQGEWFEIQRGNQEPNQAEHFKDAVIFLRAPGHY